MNGVKKLACGVVLYALVCGAFVALADAPVAESSSRFASGGDVTLLKNGTEAAND